MGSCLFVKRTFQVEIERARYAGLINNRAIETIPAKSFTKLIETHAIPIPRSIAWTLPGENLKAPAFRLPKRIGDPALYRVAASFHCLAKFSRKKRSSGIEADRAMATARRKL